MNGNGTPPRKDWRDLPEWIDIRLASELSGYNSDYLRRVMRQGKIAAEKRGTMWWIDRDSLRAYVATVEALGTKKFDPRGAPELAKQGEE